MTSVDLAPSNGAEASPANGFRVVALVGAAAFGLGVLTSYGQAWLPDEARSIANSAGTWAVAAFLLALLASTAWMAAICGAEALLALLAGYFLASILRDFSVSRSIVVFWAGSAVVVGPMLGLGAFWLRGTQGILAALSLGSIAGVLVGEGAYGLQYIADTTYPPFWWGELALGVAILGIGIGMRLRGITTSAVAVATTLSVALAFVAIYSQGAFILA